MTLFKQEKPDEWKQGEISLSFREFTLGNIDLITMQFIDISDYFTALDG